MASTAACRAGSAAAGPSRHATNAASSRATAASTAAGSPASTPAGSRTSTACPPAPAPPASTVTLGGAAERGALPAAAAGPAGAAGAPRAPGGAGASASAAMGLPWLGGEPGGELGRPGPEPTANRLDPRKAVLVTEALRRT